MCLKALLKLNWDDSKKAQMTYRNPTTLIGYRILDLCLNFSAGILNSWSLFPGVAKRTSFCVLQADGINICRRNAKAARNQMGLSIVRFSFRRTNREKMRIYVVCLHFKYCYFQKDFYILNCHTEIFRFLGRKYNTSI